jgi:hypothetical protein
LASPTRRPRPGSASRAGGPSPELGGHGLLRLVGTPNGPIPVDLASPLAFPSPGPARGSGRGPGPLPHASPEPPRILAVALPSIMARSAFMP